MQTLIAYDAQGTDGLDPAQMEAIYDYYGYRVRIPAALVEPQEIETALYNALTSQQQAFVDERKSAAEKLANPATIAASNDADAAFTQLNTVLNDLQAENFATLSAGQRTEALRLGVLVALRILKWVMLRFR